MRACRLACLSPQQLYGGMALARQSGYHRRMAVWKIQGWDSTEKIFEIDAPGNLERSEVVRILQRLACQHLSPREIVGASVRSNHRIRNNLLQPIGQSGGSVHIGQNPYYIAFKQDL